PTRRKMRSRGSPTGSSRILRSWPTGTGACTCRRTTAATCSATHVWHSPTPWEGGPSAGRDRRRLVEVRIVRHVVERRVRIGRAVEAPVVPVLPVLAVEVEGGLD